MGCAASSIDKEEKVMACKERKRLMKQLLGFREEFAYAQLAYLRALRNTGVTLRQFTESESLELENTSHGLGLGLGLGVPLSPPPTLPPSPPPPPPFSPDLRKPPMICQKNNEGEERMETEENDDDSVAIPPPPIPTSSWNFWDPFESLGPPSDDTVVAHIEPKCREMVELDDEEDWAETKSEFEEEEEEEEDERQEASPDLSVQQTEAIDTEEHSSMTSWYGVVDSERTTVFTDHRTRTTLEGIIRELDDYFLKASGCEKEIAVIIDISSTDIPGSPRYNEAKRKRSNPAKVFSVLSWSWPSRSPHMSMDASPVEPCRPGAHRNTLEKLYATEKKLYENVRNKEIAETEHERKSALLKRQDSESYDRSKIEKTRLSIEILEEEINRMEDSISMTGLCLQKLIDEELYPQLIALTSGLGQMWKSMNECHQAQTHISQQLNHLSDCPSMDLSSEYKRRAATQLETEVVCWYSSFCKLVNSQREYVKTLCKWIQCTECPSSSSAAARKLCGEWRLVTENLPDKVASEAVKSFMVSIQSIIRQQAEEYSLKRKCGKLEKRVEKEMNSLAEMERKLEGNSAMAEASGSSCKHPISVKRVKIEALKKRLDVERAKFSNSVEVSKRMTIENLKSSLPGVFRALTAFSNAISRGFEDGSQPERASLDAVHSLCSSHLIKDDDDDEDEACV